jgi:hypothetical protein
VVDSNPVLASAPALGQEGLATMLADARVEGQRHVTARLLEG